MLGRRSRVYYIAAGVWLAAAIYAGFAGGSAPRGELAETLLLGGLVATAILSMVEMAVLVDHLETDRPDLFAEHAGSSWLWWGPTQWRLMWFTFSSEGDDDEKLRESKRAVRATWLAFVAAIAGLFALTAAR